MASTEYPIWSIIGSSRCTRGCFIFQYKNTRNEPVKRQLCTTLAISRSIFAQIVRRPFYEFHRKRFTYVSLAKSTFFFGVFYYASFAYQVDNRLLKYIYIGTEFNDKNNREPTWRGIFVATITGQELDWRLIINGRYTADKIISVRHIYETFFPSYIVLISGVLMVLTPPPKIFRNN